MAQDIIKRLPESVANQIAAGEVIQRPASVIKELVENAIDAGAKRIQIVVKDAGKTLVQVIDDGCGMSEVDARMAFERHATSKIRKADDMFDLHTMGFRGEALPSIAAVSELEMRTMRPDDQIGTRIVIKASKVESQEPDVCAAGTNIMVKHLFYNFVARRRFLRKDSVELSHIMREFERLALVNPQVDLSIAHNGKTVHQLLRGTLQSRIAQLFGRTVESKLIPVATQTAMVKISGFIGLPEAARQRNYLQYFFVNGRNMKHPYFHRAVLNSYSELISSDAQPNYFISFEVDPSRIDINVHPQKHEIKFEDENLIWQVLTAAIKETLGKHNVGPAIDFNATDVPDIPPISDPSEAPDSPIDSLTDPGYNPFSLSPFPDFPTLDGLEIKRDAELETADRRAAGARLSARPSAINTRGWEKLYADFEKEKAVSIEQDDDAEPETADRRAAVSDIGNSSLFQLRNRWIVAPSPGGLMIVDQHRAHVRILFDRAMSQLDDQPGSSQKLMFEEPLSVDASLGTVLQSALPMLTNLGFELEPSGDGVSEWRILGVPAELGKTSPAEALQAIAHDLAETGEDPGDRQRRAIALAMARTSAIRPGAPLTDTEMQYLLSDLLRLPTPGYTPDGLTVLRTLTPDDLTRLFGR